MIASAAIVTRVADAFFAPRTDSYGFWIVASRDEALARFLTASGVEQIDDLPHMVVECAAVQQGNATVPVEPVTDEPGLRAFVDVAAAGFATGPAGCALTPPAIAAPIAQPIHNFLIVMTRSGLLDRRIWDRRL